jgi:hypothetical protein
MTNKRDLVQILQHMKDKHVGHLGITHAPVPLGMLGEIIEALQDEPSAGHTAHCVKRLEDIGCDCGSGHTAECQLYTAHCTCGADDPPSPNRGGE